MIIETPYKTHDTITIRTSAGEELLARFVEETEKTITIQKPLALIVSQQGLGLGPFTFSASADAKISLRKESILFIVKTDADMAKQYVQSTSGLRLV